MLLPVAVLIHSEYPPDYTASVMCTRVFRRRIGSAAPCLTRPHGRSVEPQWNLSLKQLGRRSDATPVSCCYYWIYMVELRGFEPLTS